MFMRGLKSMTKVRITRVLNFYPNFFWYNMFTLRHCIHSQVNQHMTNIYLLHLCLHFGDLKMATRFELVQKFGGPTFIFGGHGLPGHCQCGALYIVQDLCNRALVQQLLFCLHKLPVNTNKLDTHFEQFFYVNMNLFLYLTVYL